MPGKCYSCAASFGFFKKEDGCKNCGFAFCKDCLTKKAPVPRHGNEKLKVCNQCYSALTGGVSKSNNAARYSPPEAYKKRIAALEHKDEKQPKTTVPNSKQNQYKGFDKKDIPIVDRLQKLKDDRKKDSGPIASQKDIEQRLHRLKDDKPPAPSSDEMERRLALLKGQDPNNVNKPHVFKKDTRSEQKQIDDLMSEINDEIDIDSHGVNAEADVQQRLDEFKGKDNNAPQDSTSRYPAPTVSTDYKSQTGENVDISEMNNLMAQIAKDMDIDARAAIAGMEKDKELMARLGQLKQDRKNRQTNKEGSAKSGAASSPLNDRFSHLQTEFSDSEDEEETIKRILKQSLEESLIDDEVEASGYATHNATASKTKSKKTKPKPTKLLSTPKSDDEGSDSDELPWCCICNEDATLKCVGCDYDLYCKRCYKEGHDRMDYEDHTCIPYKAKKRK